MHEIPLTKGKVAIVDDDDFYRVARLKWRAKFCRRGSKWYAFRREHKESRRVDVFMHRFILNPPEGMHVDHRDGNGLNNCRTNIRICTPAQNASNRRKTHGRIQFKGVRRSHKSNTFTAELSCRHLGSFRTAEQAARAYDQAARIEYGDFACLNFPLVEAG